jgi:two-component system cell cycle response regulator DivK
MTARPKPQARKPESGETARKPLILIVDDFADNRAMYAEYLTFSGFRVEEAANGQEAVEKTQKLLPDLVVMDLALPVMDGWEATRVIKADPRTSSIPVVALTGHALDRHSKKAKEAGCDDFLAKPCLPDTLVDRARELVGKTRPKAPKINRGER